MKDNKNLNMDTDNSVDLEKDPVFVKAIKYTEEDNKNTDDFVDELLGICHEKLTKNELTPKELFIALGKTIMYTTQTMCASEQEFKEDVAKANRLVTENVFPSLGANAENEELNKSGIVTYNGKFDIDNFKIKTLMQVSAALISYTYWKTNYSRAIEEYKEEQEQEKEQTKKEN